MRRRHHRGRLFPTDRHRFFFSSSSSSPPGDSVVGISIRTPTDSAVGIPSSDRRFRRGNRRNTGRRERVRERETPALDRSMEPSRSIRNDGTPLVVPPGSVRSSRVGVTRCGVRFPAPTTEHTRHPPTDNIKKKTTDPHARSCTREAAPTQKKAPGEMRPTQRCFRTQRARRSVSTRMNTSIYVHHRHTHTHIYTYI